MRGYISLIIGAWAICGLLAQRPSQLDNPQFVEYFPNSNTVSLWPRPRRLPLGVYQESALRFWMWGGRSTRLIVGNATGPFSGGEVVGNLTIMDMLTDLNILDISPTGDSTEPLMTADWTSNVSQNGNPPTYREHSATVVVEVVDDGSHEYMYVFGGSGPLSLPPVVASFDDSVLPVYRLKLDNGDPFWNEVNTTADSPVQPWENNNGYPTPKYGMSADFDSSSNKVALFGGYSEFLPPWYTNFYFNELWVLDTATNQWCMFDNSSTTNPTHPEPRAFHASTFYQGELWIFGGQHARSTPIALEISPKPLYNDVWRFQFNDLSGPDPCSSGGVWTQVVPSTSVEYEPRIYSAAVLYQNSFIIYAGNNLDVPINSMYVWDFDDLAWTAIPSGYPATYPRAEFLGDVVDFTFFGKLLVTSGQRFPNEDLNSIGLVSIDPIEAALAACVRPGQGFCQSISDWDGSNPVCCVEASVGSTTINFNPVFPTYSIAEKGECETSTIRFEFASVSEVNELNTSLQSVNMDLNNWEFLEGDSLSADVSNYNLINDAGLQMNFTFSLIREETEVQFGPDTLEFGSEDNKWAFSQQGWQFIDSVNHKLMLEVNFVSDEQDFLGFDSGILTSSAVSVERRPNNQTAYSVETALARVTIVLADFAVSEHVANSTGNRDIIPANHRVDIVGARQGRVRIFFPSIPNDHRLDYDPEFSVLLTSDNTDCDAEPALEYLLLLLTIIAPCCAICCVCAAILIFLALNVGIAPLGYKAAGKLGYGPQKDITSLKMISFNMEDGKKSSDSTSGEIKTTSRKTGSSGMPRHSSGTVHSSGSGLTSATTRPKPDNELDEALDQV